MKFKKMIAVLGVLTVMGTGAAAADAQVVHRERVRVEHRETHIGRHDGRHDNRRWKKRVRCHTEWRHHRRVRICRR